MRISYLEEAVRDLEESDRELRLYFKQHIEKMAKMPPRRHMKFGVPYHVEDVTRQARLIYELDGGTLYIIRCFTRHKDYEKWYKSFK